jgi:hypothetical protein
MIVKELFGTKIINASFLFANSNISVKDYSKDFPSVPEIRLDRKRIKSYTIKKKKKKVITPL